MKAIEFKTKLRNNTILIPKKIHKQITSQKNKDVRVIVLMEEQTGDETGFRTLSREQFLKGYAKSDAIYDHY